MVRAALLRRSCDGVAAPTELRRPAPSRRDALNDEPASFSLVLIQISMVVAHSPRPPPWPRNFVGQGHEPQSYINICMYRVHIVSFLVMYNSIRFLVLVAVGRYRVRSHKYSGYSLYLGFSQIKPDTEPDTET